MGALKPPIDLPTVCISKLENNLSHGNSQGLPLNTEKCRRYFNLESCHLLYLLPLTPAFMPQLHNHPLERPNFATKHFIQESEELLVRKGLR